MELKIIERFEKSILLKKIKDIGHSCQEIVLATRFFVNIFYMIINFTPKISITDVFFGLRFLYTKDLIH